MTDYTDVYFRKTRNCVADDNPRGNTVATYGVFLRHTSVAALEPALTFLKAKAPGVKIFRHFPDGARVPAESPLFSYQDKMRDLVEIETRLLQRVGFACISAFNAYQMSRVCPKVPFLDMAARHCAPDEGGEGMIQACAYGASVGSQAAQMDGGVRGFAGSSLDLTAPYYGGPDARGLGTMPHALIGLAGSTVKALEMFVQGNPNDPFLVALVDYYGCEYTDAIQCADWFKGQLENWPAGSKSLGVRLDTHGGRFAEGLDYERSVEIVGDWLHEKGKWPCVRKVMGDDAFEIADDAVRDQVARVLFGTGVSLANIVQMRHKLNDAGHKDVKIVASSGFNLRKCRIMSRAAAPIDLIGTGSFLPETMNETYATADIYAYNGVFGVKLGREQVFRDVAKQVLDRKLNPQLHLT